MHHIVQANLFNEFGFKDLLNALDENECLYTVVKVIPFAHTLEPEITLEPDERVMVWGSLTLGGIATERGWEPGAFQGPEFDMQRHMERFGHYMLNHDAKFCTFGELNFKTPMFVRPVHDTKTFTGEIVHPEELTGWQEKVLNLSNTGYSSLTPETPVMYAPPKQIDFESRFFIVDGIVVTGSVYRSFGTVLYNRIDSSNALFYPMMEFARSMTYMVPGNGLCGEPIAKAYVLDIAMTDGECSVIEVNSIGSAGFYSADMAAVVRALEGMYSN
jgi:hypothetical protein